jgi:excisionase family DNA binding protein
MSAARDMVKAKLLAIQAEVQEALVHLASTDVETAKPLPQYMTIDEYAEHRRVHERTVRRWIKLGLPSDKRGRVVRIPVSAADAWDETIAIKQMAARDTARSR